MNKYIVLLIFVWCAYGPLKAVHIYNITEAPIYFAVYSKIDNDAVKYTSPQGIGYYTVLPNGADFLYGTSYDEMTPFYLEWPPQQCEAWFSGSCVSHYPRTVFFSFEKRDIKNKRINFYNPQGEPTVYLGKNINSALYQGQHIEDDKSYFLFYNPFGFDPLYAVHRKHNSDIQGGKLNACRVDDKIADSLHRYLVFTRYIFFE